jgi:hypothetical protein
MVKGSDTGDYEIKATNFLGTSTSRSRVVVQSKFNFLISLTPKKISRKKEYKKHIVSRCHPHINFEKYHQDKQMIQTTTPIKIHC